MKRKPVWGSAHEFRLGHVIKLLAGQFKLGELGLSRRWLDMRSWSIRKNVEAGDADF